MGRTYYDEATSLYETLSSEVFTVLSRPFTPWSFRRLSFAALSANDRYVKTEYLVLENSAK